MAASEQALVLHPHLDPRRQVTRAIEGVSLVHKRRLLNEEGRKLTECEAHMRRARHRDYKEEFKPARGFEGFKEGYVFGTGTKGTGYYLDPKWCEFNEPDADGYVLVRTAPAVAVHRAIKQGAGRGLLFGAVLDALGPAHGNPPHRYLLATPPWMCGMRPPPETHVEEKLAVRNELYFERLRTKKKGGSVVMATVVKKAIVREGMSLDSERVGELHKGAGVVVAEFGAEGATRRVRIIEPVKGWVSEQNLDVGGLTVVDGPAFEATTTIEARCGQLALRGDDLEPEVRTAGRVTLKNPRLSLKLTLKPRMVAQWDVRKLADTFAAQYQAKFEESLTFRVFDDDDADDRFFDPDTRLAEILGFDDNDGLLAGSFVVRAKRGADSARPLILGRQRELARRREEKGPAIDEWSTQADVVAAHAKKTHWDGPMTSEEIQAYWAKHKDYKHWRTNAALKGFTTGTEDKAKLDAWAETLRPQPGFLEKNDPLYSDADLTARRRDDKTKGSSEARLFTQPSRNS